MKKIIIGIDISAKTLDLCVKRGSSKEFIQIENSVKSIRKFLQMYVNKSSDVIVSMENTGRYNWNLYEVLEKITFEVFDAILATQCATPIEVFTVIESSPPTVTTVVTTQAFASTHVTLLT